MSNEITTYVKWNYDKWDGIVINVRWNCNRMEQNGDYVNDSVAK